MTLCEERRARQKAEAPRRLAEIYAETERTRQRMAALAQYWAKIHPKASPVIPHTGSSLVSAAAVEAGRCANLSGAR